MSTLSRHTFLAAGFIIAMLLGIYAQDLSYFLHDNFPTISLTLAITLTTFLSILLFATIISIYIIAIKNKKQIAKIYIISGAIIATLTVIWSFIVWVMWLG